MYEGSHAVVFSWDTGRMRLTGSNFLSPEVVFVGSFSFGGGAFH